MAPLRWPERYAVEVRPLTGESVSYEVLTWLGEAKAVVLACEAHRERWPEQHIYDVSVTPLGAAPKDDAGIVDIGCDLHDRMEF